MSWYIGRDISDDVYATWYNIKYYSADLGLLLPNLLDIYKHTYNMDIKHHDIYLGIWSQLIKLLHFVK